MNSFELNLVDDKSRAGSQFMFEISQELQRAFLTEKRTRKITQQAIADKLGTTRQVINRQLQGLENLTARRIGELFWALGWEPSFCASRLPDGENQFRAPSLKPSVVSEGISANGASTHLGTIGLVSTVSTPIGTVQTPAVVGS